MHLFAQSSDFEALLNRLPADEMVGVFAIATVFTTVLLIVITVCVTRTISSIRIASINAKLADKLAQQGMSADQIESIVKTSSRRGMPVCWPNRWQRATPLQSELPGKPARFEST